MSVELHAIAGQFADAWAGHRQIAFAAGLESAEQAYRIQDLVYAARHPGIRAQAWKAGASGPDVEPTAAPIGSVLASPATVGSGKFHMLGIEAELAFRLGRDLPMRSRAIGEEELAEAVDQVLVTIELCDTRLVDWTQASALSRLADFQLNGALITGSGIRDWRAVDYAAQHAELWVNGEKKLDRVGSHPLGNPFRILPWAVAHCAQRGRALRSGDLVTTGSWTGMEFVVPGDAVQVKFPGIGEACLNIG